VIVRNHTNHHIKSLLEQALDGFDHSELVVEIKYCPADSKRIASGTYYRWAPKAPDGRLIRLRINRANRYPVKVPFKTSDYYTKKDHRGREVIYQKFRVEEFSSAEHVLLAVFLHEYSHYLDHVEGRNGRYKQTKADRFAIDRLVSLGIVNG
jgi:hypothetical protein